jgi:hypothetical protein
LPEKECWPAIAVVAAAQKIRVANDTDLNDFFTVFIIVPLLNLFGLSKALVSSLQHWLGDNEIRNYHVYIWSILSTLLYLSVDLQQKSVVGL